jgi:hypothetical protein
MKLTTNTLALPGGRVANLALGAGLFALVTLTLTPQAAHAQDLSLDNFATGAGKIEAKTGTHQATQNGHGIVVGARTIVLTISSQTNSGNEFDQPIEVAVEPSKNTSVPSAFLWTVGYGALPRIDLIYGNSAPLALNLTPYDRLRVTFAGLTNALNFNIVAWQSNGVAGSAGCNLSPFSGVFTVDFALSAFVLNGGGPVDWSNIETLDIVFQAASLLGSPNLAITGFSAIPASDPPGSIPCGTSPQ